jgi:hypothetical protein
MAFSPPLASADDHLDLLTEAVRSALEAAG